MRITASGVRSSWEALATNRRWVSNASASRSSIASKVSASSATSSSGAGVADPLVEVLLGEPLGGGGHLVQRAQSPAGDDVGAGDPDHADQQQRRAALGQQLRIGGGGSSSATAGRRRSVPLQHDPGVGLQLIGGTRAVDEEYASSSRTSPTPTSRTVEQRQPQPQGRAEAAGRGVAS